MKAAVYRRYGAPEVVKIETVDKPVPADHEVLLKIHATAVNSADSRLRRADPFAVRFVFGLFRPRKPILGGVWSGVVEAVGKNVTKYRVGDALFGATAMVMGAHAEYLCLPESGALAHKPDNFSHEEAAALPFGGMTALYFLRKAGVQSGQKVLIYGASGAVGIAAVQIARSMGAHVTAVCSTGNVDWVASLGADEVVDYTRTDLSTLDPRFDVVYETVNKLPVSDGVVMLRPGGKLILGAALLKEMLAGGWRTLFSGKKMIAGVAAETAEAAGFLADLAETGRIKAAIGKVFSFEQITEAHAWVDGGHKRGNAVIRVCGP